MICDYKAYDEFISNGGEFECELDAEDIVSGGIEEIKKHIDPKKMESGFELPPPSNINNDNFAGAIYVLADEWGRKLTAIYRRGGKINYKRLLDGRFKAICKIPKISEPSL
jgi:hypothetical protein